MHTSQAFQCTTTTTKRLKTTPSQQASVPEQASVGVPQQASVGVPERLGEQPLRVAFVGHNPSDHAWSTGHYYSNPSNWFWRILKVSWGHLV